MAIMRSFFEGARRDQLLEVIRWLCLLPVAWLAEMAVQLVGGGLSLAIGDETWRLGSRLMLAYVLPKLAFVLVGGKIAPRWPGAVAAGLAVVTVLLSLVIHVAGQYAAGNRVGIVNYLHFGAETLGAVGGVILMALPMRKAH